VNEPAAFAYAVSALARAEAEGFAWPSSDHAWAKVTEEVDEVRAAIDDGGAGTNGELGDLLLALVSLARWTGVDPDAALRDATRKFEARLRVIRALAPGPLAEVEFEQQLAMWRQAKRHVG
jgi:uncharacterized protein YabN with tetrapyrrole methylase and pyrophosphatase domain